MALLLLGTVLLGCAGSDPCATLCASAKEKFVGCLQEREADWGTSVGFTSEADFDDWCATFVWEEQLLDRGAQCPAREAIVTDGTCDDWYTAWGDTL